MATGDAVQAGQHLAHDVAGHSIIRPLAPASTRLATYSAWTSSSSGMPCPAVSKKSPPDRNVRCRRRDGRGAYVR